MPDAQGTKQYRLHPAGFRLSGSGGGAGSFGHCCDWIFAGPLDRGWMAKEVSSGMGVSGVAKGIGRKGWLSIWGLAWGLQERDSHASM